MRRVLAFLIILAVPAFCRADNPPNARPVPPALARFLELDVDGVLRLLDKNHDGYLTPNELPARLAKAFETFDTNGDGKLDREEIEQMMQRLRKRFGIKTEAEAAKPAKTTKKREESSPEVDALVEQMLRRMDTNKDGKISREEAKAPLLESFDRIDTNKDGYLDRQELRRLAERVVANRRANGGNRRGPQPPDFDALDKNADGRLTRDELAGTPFAAHFDEIDTNKDGKITRKEFDAYLETQAEKAASKQAKDDKK